MAADVETEDGAVAAPKGKRGRLIIIIAAALVVLLIAGAVFYFVVGIGKRS